MGVGGVSGRLYGVARFGQGGNVDAHLPADRRRGIARGMSRREAFLRSRKIQERKVCARVCSGRPHLSRERGDRLRPRVEVPQQRLAPESREPLSSYRSQRKGLKTWE